MGENSTKQYAIYMQGLDCIYISPKEYATFVQQLNWANTTFLEVVDLDNRTFVLNKNFVMSVEEDNE